MKLYANVKENDRTFVKIYSDEENQLICNEWIGFLKKEQVIPGALKVLELIRQTNAPYMLNDGSKNTGPWADSNEWIATEWMPQAVSSGMKYFAQVLSPNIFSQLSAQQMEANAAGFQMKMFESAETARKWLEEMRKKELQAQA